MSERMRRVNSVIQHELTELISEVVDFKPGVFATVIKVDTSIDFSLTKIFISVFPTEQKDYTMKTLGHERNLLQKRLNKKLHLKVLPKIVFVYSGVGEDVDILDELIQNKEF